MYNRSRQSFRLESFFLCLLNIAWILSFFIPVAMLRNSPITQLLLIAPGIHFFFFLPGFHPFKSNIFFLTHLNIYIIMIFFKNQGNFIFLFNFFLFTYTQYINFLRSAFSFSSISHRFISVSFRSKNSTLPVFLSFTYILLFTNLII